MTLRVFENEAELAAAAADAVSAAVRLAVSSRSRCTLALSGGSTPRSMHRYLAVAEDGVWDRVDVFWGDERAVPPDHPDSNYGMARETLLDPLGIAPSRVHRMRGEAGDLEQAAREYEHELRETVSGEAGGMPVLDLVVLGLGTDAHTASLFPGTAALDVIDRAVVAQLVPRVGGRLTLTFPVLLAARAVLVLVAGGAKAPALDAALRAAPDPRRWPAQRLREAGGRVTWFADRAAAAGLDGA